MKLMPNRHPHEDEFEDYAFDRLSGDEAAGFEEHLLICEKCQNTLQKTEEYIRLMRAATAAYVAAHPDVTRHGIASHGIRSRDHGLRWNAAAAAALLLTCLTALLSWRTPAGDTKAVLLEANRGAYSHAPAGQPLDLKIDLKDVPPAPGYRVEVVDATGRRVWFGGTPARLTKGLPQGVYWVRLSTDTGESLREYGLSADKQK